MTTCASDVRRSWLACCFIHAAILFWATSALAADLTWTGAVSTDWTNSANWNPQQVPTAGDHVIIPSGNVTIPASAAFGSMDWTGGYISGSLTVVSSATLNIGGTGFKQLLCPLTNAGSVIWTGNSQVQMVYAPPSYTGVIYNQAGALFDLQSDALLNYYTGSEVFNNAGTVRKSAGTNTSSFYAQLNNNGAVLVRTGTLALGGGGPLSGQFTVDAGSILLLNGGNFVQAGNMVISGAGVSQFLGSTLTLVSDVIPGLALNGGTVLLAPTFQGGSITNLTLTGSSLSETNRVSGTLNWNAGALYGALTVNSSGVLNIGGTVLKQLLCPLTNAGSVAWTGNGQVQMVYGPPNYTGAIYNQAGALFDIQGDTVLSSSSGGEVFNNAGTVRKSAGSGTSYCNLQLNNAGTVQVQSGTLSLGSGGALSGQFTASAGAALLLNGGNFVQSGNPVFTGAGTNQFFGSTLTLVSDVIPGLALNGGTVLLAPTFQGGSITNLTLTGSSLGGTNRVSGTLNWNAGGMYGALTVNSTGVLNIGGGNTLKQLLCPLTNAGSVVWPDNGQVQVVYSPPSYTGVIYNQAGALFDLQGDNVLTSSTGNEVFNNAGTLRKSAGSGTSYCNLLLNNAGTVQVQSGTLSFGSGGALSGQFTASAGAALLLNSGNFVQTGNAVFSGAGASQFLGSTLTLVSDVIPGLALNSGTVVLGPAFQGGSVTNLTLAGSSLSGTNAVSGTLNWNAGALYGALTVDSSGVLNIGGGNALKQLICPLTNAGSVIWTGNGQVQQVYSPPSYNGVIYNQAGALFDMQGDTVLSSSTGNEVFNNAGTLRKSIGTGTSALTVQLRNNSGTLEAHTGVISLYGGYVGTGNPNLAFSLGGPATGSGYGQIAITGPLVLSGSLTATTRNAYRPNPGDSFQVLTYGSVTGAPGCLGLDLGGGLLLQPQFGPTSMNLFVTTYSTNATLPTLSIALTPGGVLLNWPLGFPGWTLQGTTNLASHVWTPIPTPCGNQALVPTAAPRQYFRLVN